MVLTPGGFKKLQEELENLKMNRRREIADRIKQAKEYGDLSENAEYQEAKEEQAFNEGRILELEHQIKTAMVTDDSGPTANKVSIGSRVVVDKQGEKLTFIIVGSTEADPVAGKISIESPLGAALLDKKAGDEIKVNLPIGEIKYKILEIR